MQILGVPEPAEADPERTKETVSVHCLAGSSFELEVSSGETGWDVAGRVAVEVGHLTETLMLTSGGCVLDQHRPLLQQVQNEEITYLGSCYL